MRLIFRMLCALVGVIFGRLRSKSVMFFVAWLTLANLDAMIPALGGDLQTVGLVVGMPLILLVYAWVRYSYDGGVEEFAFATKYLFLAAFLCALRAWSEAAGGGLPDLAAGLVRVVLGTPGAAALSALVEGLGHREWSPLPLVHPDGWRAQLLALDPFLSVASLGSMALALASMRFILREFGGAKPVASGDMAESRRSALLSPRRANRNFSPLSRRVVRAMTNAMGHSTIASDELIVATDHARIFHPTVMFQRAFGRLLTLLGVSTHLTPFDPKPLIVVSCEGSAIFAIGAGGGKTAGWEIANQATIDGPLISIQSQGNAAEQEIPLRRALGRTPHLFDPKLGRLSASVQALEGLHPDAPDFDETITMIAEALVDEGKSGEHADLKGRTKALIAIAIAGNVDEAVAEGAIATLAEVYADLSGPELIGRLYHWAGAAPVGFRADAAILAEDMEADPQLVSSLRFFVGQLRWLGAPATQALVCGGTDTVVDPRDLAVDRGRSDWIVHPMDKMMVRLLLALATKPHFDRTAEQSRPLPRTTVMIGETFALGHFPLLQKIIEEGRQKGLRAVLLMQSPNQINILYGTGRFDDWVRSAHVVGFSRFVEAEFAATVSAMAGETAEIETDRMNSPGGGLGGFNKRWVKVPLLSKERLAHLPRFTGVIFAFDRNGNHRTLVAPLPIFFRHPSLRAWVEAARARFGAKPRPPVDRTRLPPGDAPPPPALLPAPAPRQSARS